MVRGLPSVLKQMPGPSSALIRKDENAGEAADLKFGAAPAIENSDRCGLFERTEHEALIGEDWGMSTRLIHQLPGHL